MADKEHARTRRDFLIGGVRGACLAGIAGIGGVILRRSMKAHTVWQIDPYKCNKCGNCATYCVLKPSAVKCVHAFNLCGYCDRCFGYFDPRTREFTTAAENQLCPMGALSRTFIEPPYYEYRVSETKCIGCAKCVKGCTTFGNGSLILQIRHDRCLNCNECSIAAACPSNAFVRVPATQPYLLKKPGGSPG